MRRLRDRARDWGLVALALPLLWWQLMRSLAGLALILALGYGLYTAIFGTGDDDTVAAEGPRRDAGRVIAALAEELPATMPEVIAGASSRAGALDVTVHRPAEAREVGRRLCRVVADLGRFDRSWRLRVYAPGGGKPASECVLR